jgi:cation:H+ antiporter
MLGVMEMAMPFLFVLFACYFLKYACDIFEQAAAFIGRFMPAGIKGATVNAIGSSMPEMCVVIACLFYYDDPAMVMVGLGVTAGSAIFNGCVIPAISIILARDKQGKKVDKIVLCKRTLIRDVFWVLLAEIALIICLGYDAITIQMTIILNLIYVGYAIHLYRDSKKYGVDEDDYEYEEIEDKGFIRNVLTFNVNALFFGNKEFNTFRALTVLIIAILIISGASHLLVEGVVGTANVMGIPAFFSGMVLGAAASSIPDLILSAKDAQKGEFEDAVANPLASNTFDTTIAFALPLLVWLLINDVSSLPLEQNEGLTFLRWSIIGITGAVASSLIFKYANVTKSVAYFLLALFVGWAGTVVLVIG